MITYKDILFSTTKLLSNNFDIDVIVEDSEGMFNDECFYVQIVPVTVVAHTKSTDLRSLMISIKYFNDDKMKNYEIANILENLFNRTLKVKDRFLSISSIEPNFLKDEVGNMLDFLINLTYCDDIKQVIEEFDNMENINLEMRG